jgi:hypothetical protein
MMFMYDELEKLGGGGIVKAYLVAAYDGTNLDRLRKVAGHFSEE